ncbi:BREX-1 system adenine-specific DNA-methyltransferase PglX [Lysinibacillus sp. NPDC098008]|uniref:BREX-1 system adenine-specific DNA-methyltransferase PglX n=1 Tax=Lysinibacillus sp. NPDC098008 TaxID=3364146 RepID=UPI00380D26CC
MQLEERPKKFPILENRNSAVSAENFNKTPGTPIAYWVSNRLLNVFNTSKQLESIVEPKKGLTTANDQVYLRRWSEVSKEKLEINTSDYDEERKSNKKWFPLNKGGEYRKWYGNNEYVVNWENNGQDLKNYKNSVLRNTSYYFKECITWNDVTSSKVSFRYKPSGHIFNDAGPSIFGDIDNLLYIIGFGNSIVSEEICKLIAPTIHYGVGQIAKLPIIINETVKNEVIKISHDNIKLSKEDWDSFETSWDFKKHPFIYFGTENIKTAFEEWEAITQERFTHLKNNERKLNNIFIEVYDLHDDFSPEINDSDVTVQKANLEKDFKHFISYAIGCSFGRYSLDEEGLIYAGGELDSSRYKTFPADEDNILPILPGAYFEDDIVAKFVDFVRVTFSDETLEENLDFIADAIGRKKTETAREAIRRYFLNDFFKDHVQTYKKRPIYWLFTSGKEKAFNCLIYMHRYDETTLSRIRTDYLHEVQIRMDAEKKDLLSIIDGDYTTKEISDAKKALKSLDKKIDELKAYDELLHHMADKKITIDLDDGVKHNYELFKGLVAKI